MRKKTKIVEKETKDLLVGDIIRDQNSPTKNLFMYLGEGDLYFIEEMRVIKNIVPMFSDRIWEVVEEI